MIYLLSMKNSILAGLDRDEINQIIIELKLYNLDIIVLIRMNNYSFCERMKLSLLILKTINMLWTKLKDNCM